MNDPTSPSPKPGDTRSKQWCPLTARQRRVAGVLVEKARTTPDAYPMTLNAITNGCNQKSNRAPQMNLSADDVETTLDELRALGVIAEVHTGGRVPKYRHYLYEWLGVGSKEMAVMTELLLRGEQTLGELRSRASRIEPIDDLAELRTIVDGLVARKQMIELTPPGRGQIVSHGLYQEKELARLKSETRAAPDDRELGMAGESAGSESSAASVSAIERIEAELADLRARVEKLERGGE